MTAFWWRQRREWRRIVPRLWLSQGELLAKDLELFEDDPEETFSPQFIDSFAKARDETIAVAKKQIIISVLIFMFLFSNYLSIGIDISIGGFSLKYGAGIPEGLLLVSNLLSVCPRTY
jgi:hypothetical protein